MEMEAPASMPMMRMNRSNLARVVQRPGFVDDNAPRNLGVSHLENYIAARHGNKYYQDQFGGRHLEVPLAGSGYQQSTQKSRVDGGSNSQWSSSNNPRDGIVTERSIVSMESDGRPMVGEVKLWEGPGNTAQKMRVYSEDGALRRFQTLVETPRQDVGHTFSVQNIASQEFPMQATVAKDVSGMPRQRIQGETSGRERYSERGVTRPVPGGSLKTFTIGSAVEQVEITIESDGLPIMATIELWEGPGQARQVAEVYVDDGYSRPFSALIDTPGFSGCTIAIRNEGTVEFPLKAKVEPYA